MTHRFMISSMLGLVLLTAAGTANAHHGFFGTVNLSTPSFFEGVVTRVEWINPHISFTLDVKDSEGKVTSWKFEGAGPGALRTRGWSSTDLKFGDTVKVEAYRAMNGTFVAAVRGVTLPDGRTLDAASDGVPPLKATIK